MITGTPFEAPFTEGWAKLPFQGYRGHYWKPAPEIEGFVPDPGTTMLKSACGAYGGISERTPALPLGDWPACKLCQGTHKPPTAEERR